MSTVRGSVRVVLAQHRRTLTAAAVLVALAAVAGGGMRWRWESAVTAPDAPERTPGLLALAAEWGGTALTLLPLLLGAFVAGPMVARELESGTHRLAWTQSVSPARWLASKLAVVLAGVLVAVPLLMAVYRVVREPFTASEYLQLPWYQGTVYRALGPVTVANALAGVALGALAGLLVRRTVPAMLAAAVAAGAVLVALQEWRQDLWPMRTYAGPGAGVSRYDSPEWGHGAGWQTADGTRLALEPCERAAREAVRAGGPEGAYESVFRKCVAERGGVTEWADYHSGADFWPLQLVESGILLVLAALAAYAAFRVLRRLHP
ncbi:ABC transporter permease [Streptomyces sp. NPDC004111]|uniref:ABC transporter permease n=1 Tax=Streptomyces sp. NPDC004111 TaxID=3364690 RepID=UPI0036773D20